MPPVGFERTIPAGERPQTYALDRADTVNFSTTIVHMSIVSERYFNEVLVAVLKPQTPLRSV